MNLWKERGSNSKLYYCIKKMLAFTIIYFAAAVALEIIILGGYLLLGYDVLNGGMPSGEFVDRIPFYGMAGFSLLTIFYVKHIEKRKLSEMGIVWSKTSFCFLIKGMLHGAAMVAIMIIIFIVSGVGEYQGIGNISASSFFFWGIAYFIQSCAEEIMCRGFLLTSLNRRVKLPLAILLSSIAFMTPHLSGILEIGGGTMVVSIVNVLLVSWLFSVIMIKESSLFASCGLHFGWNFCLGIILGLGVSGSSEANGLLCIGVTPGHSMITGGIYGIEASILLIPELLIVILLCILCIKKRRTYGIQ